MKELFLMLGACVLWTVFLSTVLWALYHVIARPVIAFLCRFDEDERREWLADASRCDACGGECGDFHGSCANCMGELCARCARPAPGSVSGAMVCPACERMALHRADAPTAILKRGGAS